MRFKHLIISLICFLAIISTICASPNPKRIISTMPSNTEILFDLDLGNKVVGVTDQCNYPPEAKLKAKIGSVNINVEKVVSLKPDLIIMLLDAQRNDVEKLKSKGLHVFTVNPHSIKDIIDSVKLVGKATGAEAKAQKLSKKMKDEILRISLIKMKQPRPKVFVLIYPEPLMTAGKGTFVDDAINICGGKNIGASLRGDYPIMSFEKLLSTQPDYIIVSGKDQSEINSIKSSSRWQRINAVKQNKLMLINSDIITRPVPRLVFSLGKIYAFINGKK